MILSARVLSLAALVAGLAVPSLSLAQDDLLMKKDWDTLGDSDQWKYADIWCVAALDVAKDTPGYNRDNVAYARKVNYDEFIDGEGGTDEEFQTNLAYASGLVKSNMEAGTPTLDQMLEGCGADLKAP